MDASANCVVTVHGKSSYVDFAYVEPAHAQIHAWLCNWAKWSWPRRQAHGQSPMFRLYRSTEAAQVYGTTSEVPVDVLAASDAQKAVSGLPSEHRMAVSWNYVKGRNPREAAGSLGVTMAGLAGLVRDGRQMLINRKVMVDRSIAWRTDGMRM